jgi:hypothetical protein
MNRQQIEDLSKQIGKPEMLYETVAREFKTEWNPAEIKGVETWIKEMFSPILRKMGIRESVEDYFGLAYTSSGKYAELGACNVHHYLTDTHYISEFVLSNSGDMFIVCNNDEENELIFGIE